VLYFFQYLFSVFKPIYIYIYILVGTFSDLILYIYIYISLLSILFGKIDNLIQLIIGFEKNMFFALNFMNNENLQGSLPRKYKQNVCHKPQCQNFNYDTYQLRPIFYNDRSQLY